MKKLLSLVILTLTLVSCQKSSLPKPYNQFYVNDYADALMTYTEREIVSYNRYLYETYGEIQIVYVTFLINDEKDIDKYDKTELFRSFKIGKNDMGLLVILYFSKDDTSEYESKQLEAYAIEIGYNLEPYLPIPSLSNLIEENLYHEDNYDIPDLMVMRLNYELLNHFYVNLYEETPIVYDMEVYFDELLDAPYLPQDEQQSQFVLFYLISSLFTGSFSPFTFLLIALFGGLSTFGLIKLKGGGGSSGGIGLFKRRR